MASLLDGLLPGNRVVTVNGTRPAVGRGQVDFQSPGATVVDDPTNQLTRVVLPGTGVGAFPWAAVTPILTASGGGFALGNGTVQAFWRLSAADTIDWTFGLTIGSTTNLGSGSLQIDIRPLIDGGAGTVWQVDSTKLLGGSRIAQSQAYLQDASTPTNNRGGQVVVSSNLYQLLPFATAALLDHLTPFTWAVGDGIYAAATVPVVPAGGV